MSKRTTHGVFTPAKKRVVASLAAIALALLLLLVALQVPSRPAYAATDLRPDLGMARFKNLQTETTSDGRRLLRFSSIIVNVGSGAFEVHGKRPDTATSTMTVTQRIFDDAGGHRRRHVLFGRRAQPHGLDVAHGPRSHLSSATLDARRE